MSKVRAFLKHLTRLRSDQQGGIALLFLLAFMALAVPVATAAVQLTGQLNLNSRIYHNRLTGVDSARAGVELALWHLRNDTQEELAEVLANGLSLFINGGTTTVDLVEGTTTTDLSEFAYADVVLTLDVSGSIGSDLPRLKQAANAIVDAFDLPNTDGRVLIGLTKFSDNTTPLVYTTQDASVLHSQINALTIGGNTNIVAAINGGALQFNPPVQTFTTPGLHTFTVPDGVTELIVEAWGGGGGGPTGTAYGSGGGGGAYSRSLISVTPGQQFDVHVGAGGNAGQAGGDSWFGSPTVVLAKGGSSPAPGGSGAPGGQAAQGVGDVRYSGGNGGNRGTGLLGSAYGGGGGGSAFLFGRGGNGGNGGGLLGGTGSGGSGTGNGGAGGSSGSGSSGNGKPGVAPGGGGGGAGGHSSTVSGPGAPGRVVVRYGDRPGIPNILVIITDGNDTSGNSLTDIQNASQASGAEVFAVGVGDVSLTTLEAIATDPDYGDGYEDGCDYGETLGHVFYVSNFNALLNLIDCIVQAVNQSALFGTQYDIQSVAPDGRTIRARVLLTPDKQTVILSWEEY